MSNSFSLDMDKYLDKVNQVPSREKPSTLKNILKQLPFFVEISELIKKFKEKEQLVDIQDTSRTVHVVEKKSFIKAFGEALSEVVLFKKKAEVNLPIEESKQNTISQKKIDRLIAEETQKKAIFKDENFFNKPKHSFDMPQKTKTYDEEVISIEEEPDNFVENTIDNLSKRDRELNQTFSEKEVTNAISSNWDNPNNLDKNKSLSHQKIVLYKAEMQEDVKYILGITHKLIKLAPRPALEDFKNSPEFQKYVYLLEKYNIAKKQK